MKLDDMHLLDECFTHIPDDGGPHVTYNVTKLVTHIEAHRDQVQLVSVPVDEEHARYCLENRGIEQDRIRILLAHPDYLKQPVVFLHKAEEDSHLLVDGSHRYVIYWHLKMSIIPAYIVPWEMAQPFIIEDAPQTDEKVIMSWSGLSALRQFRDRN